MHQLVKQVRLEESIKKSRFIAVAGPARDPQAALAFIQTHSEPEATHNCWAFRIDAMNYRFSDDGEPGGTAGKPILQAIEGKDLINTVVLVIRYFGGTKLGTGGLIRAYGGTAAKCLQDAPCQEVIPTTQVLCSADYSDMELIKARLIGEHAAILEEKFTDTGVVWKLDIADAELEAIQAQHQNLTRGQGCWKLCSSPD